MNLQEDVHPVEPEDHLRLVEVWEASVWATHDFVSEADIQFYLSLVRDGFPQLPQLACMRGTNGEVVGFVGVAAGKVEALFIHPSWRSMGIGKQLQYALETYGATKVDVKSRTRRRWASTCTWASKSKDVLSSMAWESPTRCCTCG